MKRLFVFDIDHTILSSFGHVPKQTALALSLLKKDNHILAIATGRGYLESRSLFEKYDFDYLICNGGASVYDKNGLIYERYFNFNGIDFKNYSCLCYTEKGFYGNKIPLFFKCFSSFKYLFVPKSAFFILIDGLSNHKPISSLKKIDVRKFYIFNHKKMNGFCDYKLFQYWENEDKQEGINELLKRNRDINEVICFGDSRNDYTMIKNADKAYCMRKAPEYVKNEATKIIAFKNGIYDVCKENHWI